MGRVDQDIVGGKVDDRARSLIISVLCSETKPSRFESDCYLCFFFCFFHIFKKNLFTLFALGIKIQFNAPLEIINN